jgi:radical SAM protein with 4Fe4S-binding SPASM domain
MFVPSRFVFQWHITERCNGNCLHCYQQKSKTSADLPLGDLLNIFNQFLSLIKKWRIDSSCPAFFNVTGGEPFLRDDFFQLVEIIGQNSHLFNWGIMSNGSLLTKEKIRVLKKNNLKNFQVSLEGLKKINDNIRGKGSFKKTLKAIELLREEKIPVMVSLTLSKRNMGDVFLLAKLCQGLGVTALSVRRLVPLGQGKIFKNDILEPKELKNFYLKVEKNNKNLIEEGKNKNFKIVLGCESAIFNEDASSPKGFCGLVEGMCLAIMANGDVLPCRRLPIVLGNALKDNLFDIYYSKKMKELQDIEKLHDFCKNCSNFINCFGGAKCVNYALNNKLNEPDCQCWRFYKKLN